jgi:hypothetical protein
MWGGRKGPADTPFPHSEDCKTPDAEPEWWAEPGSGGRWQRQCSCHVEYAYASDGRLDANAPATEPSTRAHLHAPSCEAPEIAQVVKVGRYVDGGWRSECMVCGTIWLYWWSPDQTDRNGRPVRREGMVLYEYELHHELAAI